MISRPVTITNPSAANSATAKRTLFSIALSVAMLGSALVGIILLLQGGLALGHLRYFIDIGQHPLHITSIIVLIFGLLAIGAFSSLALGLIQTNRTYALVAAGLLSICVLGLLALSIWSFATLASGQLPKSINETLVKELNQTNFNMATGNNIIVDNTVKMARLEKQHQCCGIGDSVDDYRSRQPNSLGSSSSGGNTRGRTSNSQRNPSSVLLPISCCNEKYRSNENDLCLDIYGNNSNPINRYNTEGCFKIISQEKFQRIQQQGSATIVAACLAVISTISVAAVLKLLNAGFQVVPIRTIIAT